MWKRKESKWLVRGGRKVRCYLCGKKILAKGDLFLFHGDTGYYSHQSCMTESTTISGNERRIAVKKIAVGAAVVGAIAAGAGKLIDISSQSKGSNSPAAQTILTSQGLIPPALTSDPANPVPGQMWYRSDAGVMAHFDGVQNRVVYSSEINDGNVNVTSKGIINGLSVLPNDGKGGFGPDITKGATAPGQYGGTYTETSGIQEALSYCKQNQIYKCALLEGTFYIDNGVTLLLPYLDVTTATPLNEFVGIDFHGQNNGGTTIQQKDISTTQTVPLIAWENNGGSLYIKDNLPYVYAYSSGLEFNTNWHIHDFTVYANVSPPSTGYAIGISAVNLAQGEATPRCKLERLTIVNNGVMVNASTPTGTLSASCLDMSGHEGSMIEKCQLKAPNSVMSLIWINGYGSGLIQDSEMYCGTIPSGVTSQEVVAAIGGAILSVRNTWYATFPSINIYNSNSSNQNEFVQIGDYGPTRFRYFNYPITTADGVGAFNLKIQIINSQDINTSPMVVHDFTGNNSVIVVEKDGNIINTISSYTDGVFVGNTNPGSYVKFASTSSSAGGIVAPNLTTPTVPASGTAQQNTNPYAVDVYVYGGDVTEIQITKNGTAYTVLSVSTAIAMSGQAYKLNSGDSITVTYSTAPSWEWLSD